MQIIDVNALTENVRILLWHSSGGRQSPRILILSVPIIKGHNLLGLFSLDSLLVSAKLKNVGAAQGSHLASIEVTQCIYSLEVNNRV